MSGPVMLGHLLLERISLRQPQPRIPERDLVMEDLTQNAAYNEAGQEQGSLAFLYLYHAIHATPLIRPGDKVLDMGCGPANQLVQIARINPQAHFIGVDASTQMLASAQQTLARSACVNVELQHDDMTTLSACADGEFDCVISTMTLHHLPDTAALAQALQAARRVLKPDGAVYGVDFGRLKRAATQRFFAQDRSHLQAEAFTLDYLHSMQAAFSVAELRQAARCFKGTVQFHTTALAPFMVVIKSSPRRTLDAATQQHLQEMYAQLTPAQQHDFYLFSRWFHAGGLNLPMQF